MFSCCAPTVKRSNSGSDEAIGKGPSRLSLYTVPYLKVCDSLKLESVDK